MGSAYYDWGDWAAAASGASPITDMLLDDEHTLASDAISLDEKVSCEISAKWVEDDTGACDGNVYLYVVRDTDGTNYETINDMPALGAIIDPTQNTTRYKAFTVDAGEVSAFKVLIDNDSGQQGALTLKYRTSILTTV